MAPAFLTDRIERLSRIFPDAPVSMPLLKVYPLHIDLMAGIAKTILEKSEGLDNITPNGAVMARPQIDDDYAMLRQAVSAETRFSGFNAASRPVLRAPYAQFAERPYATDKLHSDIWRGEPRGSLNVIIPLWGCSYSVVQFREPAHDSFRPLEDYAQGDISGHDYEVRFCEGFVYYFDAMLLHQTHRIGGDRRVSIDFRMLYEERVTSDNYEWKPASQYEALTP